MKMKAIASAGIVAAMMLAPATPATADGGDVAAGLLLGGLIGHAIAKDQQKRRVVRQSSSNRSSVPSYQRTQNREMQTALNHFGFYVGTPDGSVGPKTRAGVSGFQALLGFPPSGYITDYERTILMTAYQRSMAGGPIVAQTVASHPMGMKGLLLAQRDEMQGVSTMAQAAPVMPVAPVAAGTALVALPQVAAPAPAAPAEVPALPQLPLVQEAAAPALPSFMGSGVAQVSLASHCNKISLMTNTNGGYVTAATMSDPAFALGEQFCLARTYAMAAGEELAAKVPGATPQQIAEQCAGLGPVMEEHVSALSLRPRDEVLAGVQGFVLNAGMAPAQLAGTAKICLGVGYTTDGMDVAIASALLLVATGEQGYAELLGHHLTQGYGATTRPDLAVDWYDMGIAAMGSGKAIFAPGMGGREDLIRKASYGMAGRAEAPSAPAVTPVTATTGLPSFALAPANP
jgi:hypothetical protein